MAIVLSLITAAIFGTGDFFGGLSAKKASIVQVVAGSHLIGLVGVTIASLVFADAFRWDDFGLGAIGGAFGGIGVAFLYRRLALGPMSVVAPLTAITAAAIPTIWGAFTGETVQPIAWLGVALAFVAIALVSSSNDATLAVVSPIVVIESLFAGVGFGFFFIFIDATDEVSSPWPIVAARLLTSAALIGYLVTRKRGEVLPRTPGAFPLIAIAGVADTASNVIFLYATNLGSLTIVAVLSSLYPVATLLLARFVLSERMSRTQQVGFATAVVATALIAAA